MREPRTLIVGIGSPAGCDRIGWRCVALLADRLPPGAGARSVRSPLDVLDELAGVDRLILCDACLGAGPVGSVHGWRWPDFPAGNVRFSGTHDAGLLAACELARALGMLPPEVVLVAIEVPPIPPHAGIWEEPAELESWSQALAAAALAAVDVRVAIGTVLNPSSEAAMHESSLIRALLRQVAEISARHPDRRVAEIVVTVGPLAGVEPALMREAYERLAAEAAAPPARLTLKAVPLEAVCKSCRQTYASDELRFVCPHCGSREVAVQAGDGVVLESVALEVVEPSSSPRALA